MMSVGTKPCAVICVASAMNGCTSVTPSPLGGFSRSKSCGAIVIAPTFAKRRTTSRICVSTPQICCTTTIPGVVAVTVRGIAAYAPIGEPAVGTSRGRDTMIAGSSSATNGGCGLPISIACAPASPADANTNAAPVPSFTKPRRETPSAFTPSGSIGSSAVLRPITSSVVVDP